MADDVNLHRELERGAKAEALLSSEAYREAVTRVREGIYEKWKTSPVADRDGQFALRLMSKLIDDIEANIKEVAETGKLASLQIEQERQSLLQRMAKLARYK